MAEETTERENLIAEASSLARSEVKEDHFILLRLLQQVEFLARLDPEEAEPSGLKGPGIRQVFEALVQNEKESAKNLLVSLTRADAFLQDEDRVDLLIRALVVLQPSPPEVIRFWDAYFQPEDGFSNLTVQVVIQNGSEPALDLFEKKMADPRFSDQEKVWWMRSGILIHRYDLPLLRICERMLLGGLPENLRRALVEVLFDYRPKEWFGGNANAYRAPALEEASSEAREQLRRIGEFVRRNLLLTFSQKECVENTLVHIDSIPAGGSRAV